MATINTKDFLTSSEVGDVLGVAADTVKVYCNRGVLDAIKVGRQWLIPKAEVKRYQEERKGPGRPSAGDSK